MKGIISKRGKLNIYFLKIQLWKNKAIFFGKIYSKVSKGKKQTKITTVLFNEISTATTKRKRIKLLYSRICSLEWRTINLQKWLRIKDRLAVSMNSTVFNSYPSNFRIIKTSLSRFLNENLLKLTVMILVVL